MYWLLSAEALQRRLLWEIRKARTPITAYAAPAARERTKPYTMTGSTAVISVEGILTPAPDDMAMWEGLANTLYPDLSAALAEAQDDPDAEEILWMINSPGGSVDGYHALIDDIAEARADGKPMRVRASQAESAAYGIASAVGRIEATDRAASFGSVGVATSWFISGGMCGKVVDITSSDAPEKRPNPETDEGREVVVRYLDQYAEPFMQGIAEGRSAAGRRTSRDNVAADFGRGSSMLAPQALASGLIDSIAPRQPRMRKALDTAQARGYAPPGMVNTSAADAAPELAAAPTPAADEPLAAAALTAAERAELIELRAERQQRQDAERRTLVGELVALRAETPRTAYAEGVLVPRLASEPLGAMRERVAALRALAPREAAVSPPAIAPGVPGVALTPRQQEMAAAMSEPVRKRFLAGLASRGHKDDQ